MMSTTGLGVVGFGIGTILPDPACKELPKNLDLYIDIIVGALDDVSTLFPKVAQFVTKGVKIANDIKADFKAGKFKDGTALVANLGDVIDEIVSDAGITDSRVKLAIASAKIALRTVALILAAQGGQPAVAAAMATLSPAEQAQAEKVRALTDTGAIDRIFAAIKQ